MKFSFKIVINRTTLFNTFAFLLLSVYMWILFAFNTLNNDRANYKRLFEYICSTKKYDVGIEYGFQKLITISNSFNLDYDGFQVLIATVFVFFIAYFLKKYSAMPLFSLVLYLFFPFVLDTIQIRNSFACVFILSAFIMLFKYKYTNIKKAIVLFSVFLLIAAQFHNISVVYFLYLLTLFSKNTQKKIIFWAIVMELIIIFIGPRYIGYLSVFSAKAAMYYLGNGYMTANYTKVLFAIFLLLFPTIFFFISKQGVDLSNNRLFQFCNEVSWLSILWYPILIIDVDFFRIYRNIIVLLEIGAISGISQLGASGNKILFKLVLLLFNVALGIFFVVVFSNNIYNILHYNSVLGLGG